MEFNKHDSYLTAGFAVVQQYDPETYARMVEADWYVSTDAFKLGNIMHDAHPEFGSARDNALMLITDPAMALTIPRKTMRGTPVTYVDHENVKYEAMGLKVDGTLELAMALVHEFRHIHETSNNELVAEPPAYRAGIEFANKLPAPDGAKIASSTSEVLRKIEASHNA